jgi:hypothetical protein
MRHGNSTAFEKYSKGAAPPPMISVLRDSHNCVGFLRSAGPRGFQAYDAAGQLLGLFAEKQAAVEAITAEST